MRYMGKVISSRSLVGGAVVVAAVAASAPSAAALPTATHPVHVTAVVCEVSAQVKPRAFRVFEVAAERANCSGLLGSQPIKSAAGAKVSGRAEPDATCGWRINDGRLTLAVRPATLVRPFSKLTLPFRVAGIAAASQLAGTGRIDQDRVAYRGLVALAPEVATSRTPPRCGVTSGRAMRLSFQLALGQPLMEQGS